MVHNEAQGSSVPPLKRAPVERPREGDQGNEWSSDHRNLNHQDKTSSACIRDIFSHEDVPRELDEHVIIHPGVTFIRNRGQIHFGDRTGRRGGRKGAIVEFSDKSRRKMMITMAMLEDPLKFWQDFTFSDDVMEGKSISEKAKIAARCLKELKQWMERVGLNNIYGYWKKEWKKRRSGILAGFYVPHFHMVFTVPHADEETYLYICRKIAEKWVEITGTKNVVQALKVALHPKSRRFINSRKQMQKYMSKYMVKNEGFVSTESIGRNWGRLGNPKETEGEKIELTQNEMVLFKRCIRKMVKKARKHFKVTLRKQYSRFFLFIEERTIYRILDWITMNRAVEGVPF